MVSGFFVTDKKEPENLKNELFAVGVTTSNAVEYQPTIKLKAPLTPDHASYEWPLPWSRRLVL